MGSTPTLLPSPRRGRFRRPSALRRVVPCISPVAYSRELPNCRTAWDFTGHGSLPFSSGGGMHHPVADRRRVTAYPGGVEKVIGSFPGASLKGGSWRDPEAEMPSPNVAPPGPFDTTASSGTPVAVALAAYPRAPIARFERSVLYRRGPAQVGFDVKTSFLLSHRFFPSMLTELRATAAHAPFQGC